MLPSKESVRSILEIQGMFGTAMGNEPFPCIFVQLNKKSAKDCIDDFLNQRPNPRWVLLGEHAVQTNMQIWTAWVQAARNELRGSMVARSVDAEFLRYLAGTHHISEAFSRAGLQEGQNHAWVVYLPLAEAKHNDLGHAQPSPRTHRGYEAERSTFIEALGWTIESSDIIPSIEGMKQLGIDVEGWSNERVEESLVAHVLMADDQSSSHR